MILVVTGATSMLGTAVLRMAVNDNGIDRIYAVVRHGTSKISRIPVCNKIRIIYCDAKEYAKLPKLIFEDCDVFMHFAWLATGSARNQSINEQAMNISITIDAIDAASVLHCSKFIGAGSQAEYGYCKELPISPESPTAPVQPYGIAKLAAGMLAKKKAELLGISCIWVRVFSVYGIFDKPSSMIMSTLNKVIKGESVSFTAGENRWEYLYCDDAGRAFLEIAKRGRYMATYCLGNGKSKLLKEYIFEIKQILQPKGEFLIGKIPYAKEGVLEIESDNSSLQNDTGWQPIVPFEEGIKRTIENLKEKNEF